VETDWEEGGTGRDSLYREICVSNLGMRLPNAQVKQHRIRRLLEQPQKQRLIDHLINAFYETLKSATPYRSCTGSHDAPSQGISQLALPSNDKSSTNGNRIKRKTDHEEDDNGEEDGDRPFKRPTNTPNDKLSSLKYACPYHQHDPRRYGVSLESSDANFRSCAGPGWKSVARIK
jgi:hypothetical protein